MKVIANFIWFVIYGLWMGLLHLALGIACCATVLLIPFGLQHFKIMRYAFCPFGKKLATDFDSRPIMNLLWIVFGGYLLPLIHVLIGVVLCCTIIGIPFGKKCISLAAITMLPFGAMF